MLFLNLHSGYTLLPLFAISAKIVANATYNPRRYYTYLGKLFFLDTFLKIPALVLSVVIFIHLGLTLFPKSMYCKYCLSFLRLVDLSGASWKQHSAICELYYLTHHICKLPDLLIQNFYRSQFLLITIYLVVYIYYNSKNVLIEKYWN